MNQHHQENMQENEIKSLGDNDCNYSEIYLFYLGGGVFDFLLRDFLLFPKVQPGW